MELKAFDITDTINFKSQRDIASAQSNTKHPAVLLT